MVGLFEDIIGKKVIIIYKDGNSSSIFEGMIKEQDDLFLKGIDRRGVLTIIRKEEIGKVKTV